MSNENVHIELTPIIIGAIISVILIFLLLPYGVAHLLCVIIGSAVAGYLTNNSTRYALINGACVGIISSFLFPTVLIMPIYIILGLFGAFFGKAFQ